MDIEQRAGKIMGDLIPVKSGERYKRAQTDFKEWMEKEKISEISEKVILVYLELKSQTLAPNSLFSLFSMIKACNPNIG